ncbi:hypothetical protein [Spirillospora sp. CA-294931]|uniref:hypothetical protein n=1 Tax=Spirillospora sp. CA-294931 TaxID=3240042 RepID=UPI003D8D16CE
MTNPRLPRDDLNAAVAARRELGPDYDDAFVASVVDRIEETWEARLAAQHAHQPRPRPAGAPGPPAAPGSGRGPTLALAIISMGAAIPLSAIGVVNAGLPGLLIVWAGIVLINAVFANARR